MLDDASTKIRSAHVDRLYVRRPHPFRRARMITTLACFAAALAWSIGYGLPARSRVHDPGPLSSAHQQWQQDCRKCHDGAESRAWSVLKPASLAVSDSACLKCHDGAAHHQAQTKFISNDLQRATQCAACHVEHRGGAALAANQDQTCIQCHGTLSNQLKNNPSRVSETVVAFNLNKAHPAFGKALEWREVPKSEPKRKAPVDPTVLKFNHQKHMTMPQINNNCVLCHDARDPSPLRKPQQPQDELAKRVPPWMSNKDRSPGAIASSDGRYMRPISYERHCQSCHPLNAFGKDRPTTLVHESMSMVRMQLAQLGFDDLRAAGEYQPGTPARGPKRGEPAKSANRAAIDRVRSALDLLPPDKRTQPQAQLDQLTTKLTGAADPTTQPSVAADPSLIEMYVAYVAPNRCTYCHNMEGVVPALAKSLTARFATVPTQIPDAPRRWFPASQFDHRAHRFMSCVSCHTGALNSSDTEQLLQPTIETCVACHRTEERKQRLANTAPSNCITCHQFHDRSKERWGNLKNVTSAATTEK